MDVFRRIIDRLLFSLCKLPAAIFRLHFHSQPQHVFFLLFSIIDVASENVDGALLWILTGKT